LLVCDNNIKNFAENNAKNDKDDGKFLKLFYVHLSVSKSASDNYHPLMASNSSQLRYDAR